MAGFIRTFLGPHLFSENPLIRWFHLHGEILWWLHSFYALILGIGIMWLGQRNYTYLRVAVFHIGFIWLSSLFLVKLVDDPRISSKWMLRIRLFINFFNKNLYQQVLFFILPIYYASATLSSPNIVFVILVGLSALLSTLDVVYDRHLSVRRLWTALFFAFNVFALINLMLPVLLSVSNIWAMRVSAVLALFAFMTFYHPLVRQKAVRFGLLLLVTLSLLSLVGLGRPFIPPAPLRLVRVEFGEGFDQEKFEVESPLTGLRPGEVLPIYGLTAIKAPLGLNEKVRHRWTLNGKPVCTSPFYAMIGGRDEGFRIWTKCTFEGIVSRSHLRLDLETEGGQLIGRAHLSARS
jgi:hypothetical protein